MDNYFEWKENLKENMQEVANRTLEQIQEKNSSFRGKKQA